MIVFDSSFHFYLLVMIRVTLMYNPSQINGVGYLMTFLLFFPYFSFSMSFFSLSSLRFKL